MRNYITIFLLFSSTIPVLSQLDQDKYWALIEEFGSTITSHQQEINDQFSGLGTDWTSLPVSPSVFGRSTAGVIGDYLYIHTSQTTTSLALAFHIPTSTWSTSTSCNFPAFNSAFCVANGELYKLSGSGNVNAFEKFTPNGTGTGTWTTLTGGPTNVMNAQNSMVWDQGNYIYASSSSTASPYPTYLQRYHITNWTWETRTGSLLPKRYAGMAYLNGYIYMIGGIEGLNLSSPTCQRYNTATDTWEAIASLPESVNFTKWSVTSDINYVYLIGAGGGFSPYSITTNAYYYDPGTNTWTLDAPLPATRGLANGLLLSGFFKLFLGGGNDGTSGTAYQDDAWEGNGGVYVPVELVSFSASVSGRSVVLNWQTATETNNSGFVVERSEDNNNFSQIGFIAGSGTTTELRSYSFTDNLVTSSTYYYRLKQIDYDGSYEYSNVVEVEIGLPVEFLLEQNYPNPFNPSTKINFSIPVSEFVTLKVFDVMGNEVAVLLNEEKSVGLHSIEFNASYLASGTYFYKLQAGSNIEVRKMLLLK